MNCWNCGTANDPGARFCINCGAAQSRACEACGHLNPSTARFCANCGSQLEHAPTAAVQAAAAPEAAAGPVAERRLVSVMFVDLVGSTALAADRDPEDTRDLLSRYFETARHIVEGHGGTIEKFIGDAVMAVWGTPVANEDDAERAVRAALELVAAVPTLSEEGPRLRARAGVLTGEAAVTIGATGQGMVAGDLVNTASRLQSIAEPGTVLVGETTHRAASNAISFEEAGSRELKGKTEPVATWRAVAVVARRGGEKRSATLEPPFVGREDELRQVKDLFEATSRERKPRLVSVIGQAGIGKTRLAWEFEKYLDGVVEEVYWHEGRSPAYGEGVSYWALAEMVRRRAEILEADDAATARAKLATALETFVPDAAERRWVEPRLAGLLGISELPSEGREELFAAWRTFFERTADQAPSVLVFADLHWADQGLLDFIEYLLSWSRSSPLFVLVLARPELLERRADWGSQVRSVTRINLEPLTNEQMTRLLEGMLPGLDPTAVRRIVDRAEGIPLYAVETARMLLDTGAVVERHGRYEVVGEIARLAVAETLHALIASRLDATSPGDRSLLQDAAVLGQSFTIESLAAVSGMETPAVEEHLERLARRQLVVQDTDPRSPERGQHRFIQSLVREVAYQSLAKPDRRARHLAAARYFETLEDEELAGVLATHYLEAHRASKPGPEADALAAQARIALSGAADRASSLHSHQQAMAYLEQAITVASAPAEQAALHVRAAASGDIAGEHMRGMDHARVARDLFRALGDQAGMLRAGTWLGRLQIGYHIEDDGAETLREVIREAEPLGDVPELASALAELSRALMLTDRHADAIEVADRALEVAGRHDLLQPTVEALINRGTSLPFVGRRHESEAVLRGAIALADRHVLVAASLRARNNLGNSRATDDTNELLQLNAEGYELATRYGHRPFRYQFLWGMAEVRYRAGDWDNMLPEIDAVEEAETPWAFYSASFAAARARLAGARGLTAEAEAFQQRWIEEAAKTSGPMIDAFTHLQAAELALFRGDWSVALSEGSLALGNSNTITAAAQVLMHAAVAADDPDAFAAAEERIQPWTNVHDLADPSVVAAAHAGFAARAGRWDEARAGYAAALDGFSRLGLLLHWALTGLDWGALAADQDPAAARALEEARSSLAERGGGAMADAYLAAFVPVDATSRAARRDDAPAASPAGRTRG